MTQTILIAVVITSVIALMCSIYKLGVTDGRIQAYKEIEKEINSMQERIREKYIKQLRADIRRNDELLADDDGGGAGTGESQEA